MERISQILKTIGTCGRLYREKELAPLGISARHGLYLQQIGETPGISQEQLTQRLHVNKSNVARQVAALEEEGYIRRCTCGKDKRVLRLYLTEKAETLLPRIHQVMDAWEQQLVQGLTESEQQILEILLLRLLTSAQAGTGEVEA